MKYYHLIVMLFLLSLIGCSGIKKIEPNTQELSQSWKIQSQDKVSVEGKQLSDVGFDDKDWVGLELPSTVFNGLLKAGLYSDIYKSDNLDKIDKKPFEQAWWYRSQFSVDVNNANAFFDLVFEGINYQANVWLNGKLIADTTSIEGPFGMWSFDVSSVIKEGENIIAVQIFPAAFDDLTIGFVDWNPAAPDNNMGIWRPVKLKSHGALSISEPFVSSVVNVETLADAKLKIVSTVKNHTNIVQVAELSYEFEGIKLSKSIELAASEQIEVAFTAEEFAELRIQNPRLWWPNLMGEANLYDIKSSLHIDNELSDKKSSRFGIRQIDEYWTSEDHKGYKINGKKVLITGAGWVDDLLLGDSDDKVEAQLEYVKLMNMNTVRLEGFWGKNKTLYNKADELGLLVMIGWSCQWEWEGYCGRYNDDYMAIRTPEDQELQARAFQDQVRWLRNHPSVFLWVYGSDKLPLPALEKKLNAYVGEVDDSRPVLSSCKGADYGIMNSDIGEGYFNHSEVSGNPGVKMLGPYGYTVPLYWYVDEEAGGAFGFNTETGPGAQIPPLESIKKMIPEDKLWPMNDVWDFHSGRNAFGNLNRDMEAFNARYGKATGVEELAFNMQIHNYEAIRGMFEAFEVNKPKTTGIVQWMLNSAWPELFWQLYDWYLLPNGAFYGTQAALQPLNAIYNYGDGNVYVANSYLRNFENTEVEIKVLDINSKVIFEHVEKFEIAENQSIKVFDMPEWKKLSETYFVDLRIKDNLGNVLSNNFYWLSTVPDVFDWENSLWFYTPYKSYADFTSLNKMPKVKVSSTFSRLSEEEDEVFTCVLKNESEYLAFFIELAILDKASQETIVPVFWDENYLTLLPGETRSVKARLHKKHVDGKELEYRVKSFNQK